MPQLTEHFSVPALEEVFGKQLVIPRGHPAVFIRTSKKFVINVSNTTTFIFTYIGLYVSVHTAHHQTTLQKLSK
jgi:hypothetical protein